MTRLIFQNSTIWPECFSDRFVGSTIAARLEQLPQQALFTVIGLARLSGLRFIVFLWLISYIILIHMERLTFDFRAALVALLSSLRLIVLLRLIAALSLFRRIHCGLQGFLGSRSRDAATADVEPILNTTRRLSWSRSHIWSLPPFAVT
jgi:hypothetical protein